VISTAIDLRNREFPSVLHRIVDVWASICAKKSTGSLPELFDYVKSKQTVSTQPGRGIFPVFDASGCDLEDNTVSRVVPVAACV
jgi:hypothetical protein